MTERQRFHHEAFACARLSDLRVVPFIGVFSTREHPYALVFELMDHLNLRGYLKRNQDVGRLELVCF